MSANPQSARSPNYRESQAISPRVADPSASARAFLSEFKSLVDAGDLAVQHFIATYETRKGLAWLEEADKERGLENALLKAVSGYAEGTDYALLELTAQKKAEYKRDWADWKVKLCDATRRATKEYSYYFPLVERISVETHLPLQDVIRRLLMGYATSPNHGLASEPW